jgi:hypothetical protein
MRGDFPVLIRIDSDNDLRILEMEVMYTVPVDLISFL